MVYEDNDEQRIKQKINAFTTLYHKNVTKLVIRDNTRQERPEDMLDADNEDLRRF
jgi:hypothetical protein